MYKKWLMMSFLASVLVIWVFLYLNDYSLTAYNYGQVNSPKKQENVSSATSSSVLFTGDVFLGRDVELSIRKYGPLYPLDIFTSFSHVDTIIINFEAPIPVTHTPVPSMGMNFSVASSSIQSFSQVGIDYVSLANNHTLDKGTDAYQNTQQVFLQNNILAFGHPSQVSNDSLISLDTMYGEVAVIGLHTLYNEPNLDSVIKVFSTYASDAVLRVAYIHWGEEYQRLPSEKQKTLARRLVTEAGVDIIIGHHPHVVQTVDMINGAPVFYSLGNTIFDQYFSTAVQTGLLLELKLSNTSRLLKLHPISSIGSRNRPYLMPQSEKETFLKELSKISHPDLQEQILSGEIIW